MTLESTDCKRLNDLVRLFGVLEDLQHKLATLIQSKIDAIQKADMHAMRELFDKERDIIQRIHEREGLRCQLMDEIGKELGLPSQTARAVPASQLATRLPVSQRGILLDAAAKLRSAIGQVARINRVAGRISSDILRHLQWVFASVVPRDGNPAGYSGNGVPVTARSQRIFEAVG